MSFFNVLTCITLLSSIYPSLNAFIASYIRCKKYQLLTIYQGVHRYNDAEEFILEASIKANLKKTPLNMPLTLTPSFSQIHHPLKTS